MKEGRRICLSLYKNTVGAANIVIILYYHMLKELYSHIFIDFDVFYIIKENWEVLKLIVFKHK